MSRLMTESELRTKAVAILEQHLGATDAMRFLSLLRNSPRDYSQWRSEHFKDLTQDALIEQLRGIESHTRLPGNQD